jgi:20S proteasome alpha/beta subunit
VPAEIAEDGSNFSLQLLLCGWLPGDSQPRIYTMDRDGFHSQGIDGFAAIGSGQEAAVTSLMFQGYSQHSVYTKVVAQVCIAKFMAEYSDGVGKTTISWVVDSDEKYSFFIQPYEIERIRKFWMDAGMPRYPEGVEDFIGDMTKERLERHKS